MFPADQFFRVAQGRIAPELTILMPIYQQSAYIRQAVRSVLAQSEIVAEIIISDDGSSDDTFALAHAEVLAQLGDKSSSKGGWAGHHVLMRRGTSRLRRDHLPLLVDTARTDVVMQAHGDDLFHPQRCMIVRRLFNQFPKLNLLASEFEPLSQTHSDRDDWQPIKVENILMLSRDSIISARSKYLIGCTQAWRRSSTQNFVRLDSNYAAVGHDRITPFRCSLTGDVALIRFSLVKRRIHNQAWSSQMLADKGPASLFGWSTVKLSLHRKMLQDLRRAKEVGMVGEEQFQDAKAIINKYIDQDTSAIAESFDQQTKLGKRLGWQSADV